MKVQIMETNLAWAQMLEEQLREAGHRTDRLTDLQRSSECAMLGGYDLLILDVDNPEYDALELIRQLRAAGVMRPVVVLTDQARVEQRLSFLEAGADYFLMKSWDPRELRVCVEALVRRQVQPDDRMAYGQTWLELSTANLCCGQHRVRLSAREMDVMKLLLQTGPHNLSKNVILAQVWGFENCAVENHVEVYVGFLRKKLRAIQSDLDIVSVRRMGYHIESRQEA